MAVVTSARAPGLVTLLSAGDDDAYQLVGVVASDPCSTALPLARDAGLPCTVHDVGAFYAARGKRRSDMAVRAEYDRELARILGRFSPDVVALCGYLHILTEPVLTAHRDCLLNVHDSDLSIRDEAGRPRYRGLHATLDAIKAGERETRSTVHVVRAAVDAGPALFVSRPFPVYRELVDAARQDGATDILKAYAFAQREWMMRSAWGPMLHAALTLYADDGVELFGDNALVRGMPGPLQVRDRDDAPRRATAALRVAR